ncbi:MAG: hypothetical protein IT378_10780 [Sandaracinaceae bacterium]|nr:hypothetical protein [Sandaracinaceae bacterium]
MGFRDDREALRARAEAVEAELASARHELESLREERARAEELNGALAKKEQELAALRRKLGEGPKRRPRIHGAVLAIALFVVLAGGAIGTLAYFVNEAADARVAAAHGDVELGPTAPGAHGRVAISAGTRWRLRAGDPCRVSLEADPGPALAHRGRHRLSVWCGGERVLSDIVDCVPEIVPERCHDNRQSSIDGTPLVQFSLRDGTLRIEEDDPRSPWVLDVRLD